MANPLTIIWDSWVNMAFSPYQYWKLCSFGKSINESEVI